MRIELRSSTEIQPKVAPLPEALSIIARFPDLNHPGIRPDTGKIFTIYGDWFRHAVRDEALRAERISAAIRDARKREELKWMGSFALSQLLRGFPLDVTMPGAEQSLDIILPLLPDQSVALREFSNRINGTLNRIPPSEKVFLSAFFMRQDKLVPAIFLEKIL